MNALVGSMNNPAVGSTSESSFLYRFEARLEVEPIGVVAEGLRLIVSYDGHVESGAFRGGRVRGIDPLVIRSDGVGVIDTGKIISTGTGNVYEHLRGYCLPPAGMTLPPLSTLLAPDFEWPDVLFPVHGASIFSAAVPEHASLNRALARIDGHANFRTGRLAVEARLMHHRAQVEGPRH